MQQKDKEELVTQPQPSASPDIRGQDPTEKDADRPKGGTAWMERDDDGSRHQDAEDSCGVLHEQQSELEVIVGWNPDAFPHHPAGRCS